MGSRGGGSGFSVEGYSATVRVFVSRQGLGFGVKGRGKVGVTGAGHISGSHPRPHTPRNNLEYATAIDTKRSDALPAECVLLRA